MKTASRKPAAGATSPADPILMLEPAEESTLKSLLKSALGHADGRLCRLASDAISRAWSRRFLFAVDDLPRLRKAAEVGDTANRLYAAALLLALCGQEPDELPLAA